MLALQNRSDRLEERVSAIEWAARQSPTSEVAPSRDDRPHLPVVRLSPDSDGQARSAARAEDSRANSPAPGQVQPGRDSDAGVNESPEESSPPANGGRPEEPPASPEPDGDGGNTRIRWHHPSSSLLERHDRLPGAGLLSLAARVHLVIGIPWHEEEARCEAV